MYAFVCNLNSSSEQIANLKNYNILDGGTSLHSLPTLAGCIPLAPIADLSSDLANGEAEPVVVSAPTRLKRHKAPVCDSRTCTTHLVCKATTISHGRLKRLGYTSVERKANGPRVKSAV